MIDPDGIQIQESNLPNKIIIANAEIPVCDFECYCLEDEKSYKHYIDDIEKSVRRSFEYRRFIAYIRDYMQMNQCAFIQGVDNTETFDIKIEIHHYPFSLHDITEIVVNKRKYYNESLEVQMVAKEVMIAHYKLIIGLISLSETVHQVSHASRLFIPADKVLGRYNVFVQYYEPFIEPGLLEILDRIEKYTEEKQSRILNTTILDENRVTYQITDQNYMLPDMSGINTAMIDQMNEIRNNNYILPSIEDKNSTPIVQKKEVICPISFDPSLIKR